MKLGRVLYFGDFIACPIALAALSYETLPWASLWASGFGWAVSALVGLLGWTMVEYALHRWLYHHCRPFKYFHDMHHADPGAMIGVPSFLSIFLILLIIGAPLLSLGATIAGGMTSGVLLGYWAYVFVHHADHHWRPKSHSHLNQLRRWHAHHHNATIPCNFGITTPLWDYVFGTLFEPGSRTGRRSHRSIRRPVAM